MSTWSIQPCFEWVVMEQKEDQCGKKLTIFDERGDGGERYTQAKMLQSKTKIARCFRENYSRYGFLCRAVATSQISFNFNGTGFQIARRHTVCLT